MLEGGWLVRGLVGWKIGRVSGGLKGFEENSKIWGVLEDFGGFWGGFGGFWGVLGGFGGFWGVLGVKDP